MADMIQCDCGCGASISSRGANGKPRRFLRGHQTKNRKIVKDDSYWNRRLARLNKRRQCLCGCGEHVQVTLEWVKARAQQRNVWFPKYNAGHEPQILCGCGCGTSIPAIDDRGQPRSYVPEHAGRAALGVQKVDWGARTAAWNADAGLCGCGCGRPLTRTVKQLKSYLADPEFLPGHGRRRVAPVALSPKELSVIYGVLLGDFSISRPSPKGSPRLSFTHGASQRDYALHKTEVLSRLGWWVGEEVSRGYSTESVVRGSCSCMPSLEKVWSVVRPGVSKEVNSVWLEQLDDVSVAYWYMDDGSVSRSGKQISHAAFHTEGFSQEENELLRTWLADRFQVEVRVRPTRSYYYLYLPRRSALKVLGVLTPLLHESMKYKGLG